MSYTAAAESPVTSMMPRSGFFDTTSAKTVRLRSGVFCHTVDFNATEKVLSIYDKSDGAAVSFIASAAVCETNLAGQAACLNWRFNNQIISLGSPPAPPDAVQRNISEKAETRRPLRARSGHQNGGNRTIEI